MGSMLLEDYELCPLPPEDGVRENDDFGLFLTNLSQDDSAFDNVSCPAGQHAPPWPALDIACCSHMKEVPTSCAGYAESQVRQQQTGFTYRLTSLRAPSAMKCSRRLRDVLYEYSI